MAVALRGGRLAIHSRRSATRTVGRSSSCSAPGGRSVQELADALPISRPAVSRHLRLLKEAGLVREEPVGTRRIYRLHDEGIEAVRAYLERSGARRRRGSRWSRRTRRARDGAR